MILLTTMPVGCHTGDGASRAEIEPAESSTVTQDGTLAGGVEQESTEVSAGSDATAGTMAMAIAESSARLTDGGANEVGGQYAANQTSSSHGGLPHYAEDQAHDRSGADTGGPLGGRLEDLDMTGVRPDVGTIGGLSAGDEARAGEDRVRDAQGSGGADENPSPVSSCQRGTYDHDDDMGTACIRCIPYCEPGTTETVTCTPSSNRECIPCAGGTFDHDGDASTPCIECAPLCQPGSHEMTGCTAISNRECRRCPEGGHDDDGDPATPCSVCTESCFDGFTETRACTATTDRTCTLCEAGTYDDDGDPKTSCIPCRRDCDIGEIEQNQCTPTTNRTCGGCQEGYYLNNSRCLLCSTCEHGETQVSPCSSDTDALCEPCAPGTTDQDNDPFTPCTPCTSCGKDRIKAGICTPTSDTRCEACETNPSGVTPHIVDPENDPFRSCPSLDPFCEQTIDILVLYTDSYVTDFYNGDIELMTETIHYLFHVADISTENSLFKPTQRYRLVGITPFHYAERGKLKSDLMWLRHNPHFHEIRRSFGADVGLFMLGTSSYGGFAYSNHTMGPTSDDRGVVVIDGYFLSDEFERCGVTYETPAHELGHIIGANHLASQYMNPRSSEYAYHNQEPNFRRNEAFGLPVDQHDLKFFTLMSYASSKDENNVRQGCVDCFQLPVFASPDLWWFFDGADALHGYCLVVNEEDNGTVNILCQNQEVWTIEDNRYVLNVDEAHN